MKKGAIIRGGQMPADVADLPVRAYGRPAVRPARGADLARSRYVAESPTLRAAQPDPIRVTCRRRGDPRACLMAAIVRRYLENIVKPPLPSVLAVLA